jgi:alcohol dehydrogenase (cytochrome c)
MWTSRGRLVEVLRQAGAATVFACAACLAWAAGAATDTAGKNWPTVGGDHANTRHSTLTAINRHNVKQLGGAWLKELDAVSRSAPVFADGMLYVNDATATYAIDPRNGATIWQYKPERGAPARGGVAVGEGMVFVGMSDAHIVALEQKTGKLVWTGSIGNAVISEPNPSEPHIKYPGDTPQFDPRVGFISSAPTYVNGMVVDGLTGGDGGVRGKIAALNAKTGELAWSFYVIPSPGEAGSETWPQEGGALQRGGGAVWTAGAADPELGLVYYGTGNTVPQAGGELRPGDNLYTASVVALDTKTGQLRWHYQLTHHDIWEMDVATPIVLYTAQVDGQRRKALAGRPANRFFLPGSDRSSRISGYGPRPHSRFRSVRTASAATARIPRRCRRASRPVVTSIRSITIRSTSPLLSSTYARRLCRMTRRPGIFL